MAQIWASNSHAKRNKVGALIVKDGMIISDGFNGTPSGFENECEEIVPCGNTCTSLFGQDCEHCKEHKLNTKPVENNNSENNDKSKNSNKSKK